MGKVYLILFVLSLLWACKSSPPKQPICYFTIAGISLHTQMPKDSVVLLLGNPHKVNAKTENGKMKEELTYMVPKSSDAIESIKKVQESFKAGMLEFAIYQQLIQSFTCQLSLEFENGNLVGYRQN